VTTGTRTHRVSGWIQVPVGFCKCISFRGFFGFLSGFSSSSFPGFFGFQVFSGYFQVSSFFEVILDFGCTRG
jgi:hypothetical protein